MHSPPLSTYLARRIYRAAKLLEVSAVKARPLVGPPFPQAPRGRRAHRACRAGASPGVRGVCQVRRALLYE